MSYNPVKYCLCQQLYLRDNVGGRRQRDQIKGAATASSHADISSCVAPFESHSFPVTWTPTLPAAETVCL